MQPLSFNQLSGKSWLSYQRALDKKCLLYRLFKREHSPALFGTGTASVGVMYWVKMP